MSETHAYLLGVIGLGIIFIILCLIRKDLRRVILYSGLLYLIYGFLMFLVIKLLTVDKSREITPGYWTPPSLLRINGRTGGYGIEDALFSVFAGGIAAGLYDLLFKVKVTKKTNRRLKRGHALSLALLIGSLAYVLTSLNAIYFFIFLQFSGSAVLVWQRKDLFRHVLAGGITFMLFYGLLFTVFMQLFPNFVRDFYHLSNTSHLFIFDIPLEEYLYSLTLGMMWAPIYEYKHRVKDNKLRSLGLRRVSLAAGAAKR